MFLFAGWLYLSTRWWVLASGIVGRSVLPIPPAIAGMRKHSVFNYHCWPVCKHCNGGPWKWGGGCMVKALKFLLHYSSDAITLQCLVVPLCSPLPPFRQMFKQVPFEWLKWSIYIVPIGGARGLDAEYFYPHSIRRDPVLYPIIKERQTEDGQTEKLQQNFTESLSDRHRPPPL